MKKGNYDPEGFAKHVLAWYLGPWNTEHRIKRASRILKLLTYKQACDLYELFVEAHNFGSDEGAKYAKQNMREALGL